MSFLPEFKPNPKVSNTEPVAKATKVAKVGQGKGATFASLATLPPPRLLGSGGASRKTRNLHPDLRSRHQGHQCDAPRP